VYLAWREEKLSQVKQLHLAPFIKIKNLASPTKKEKAELIKRCEKTNMALYQSDENFENPDVIRSSLRDFSDTMGLEIAEKHRSAGKNGIVAITISDAPSQRAYMPYSKKPMNWHTDGYYNSKDEQILSMVLHCVYPASNGGKSQFFDNEIAYIRLRDKNPLYIKALMHEEAMSIPENKEENGNLRPISIGPVFSISENNELIMRYTARTRSIKWRNDRLTQEAVKYLQNLLETGDDLIQSLTLKAGQGVLCNNSLHNRTGFDLEEKSEQNRMLFRVRFHNRVGENS
jgi:hypothetical protein